MFSLPPQQLFSDSEFILDTAYMGKYVAFFSSLAGLFHWALCAQDLFLI